MASDVYRPMCDDMIRSFKKFNPKEEIIIFGQDRIDTIRSAFSTPQFASELCGEYKSIVQINADIIVTGSFDHMFNDSTFDVGVVKNNNRVDNYTVWGLPSENYYNCGFVFMQSEEFIRHWLSLCLSPFFAHYQFKEQDLLNILCHYGNYNVRCFDTDSKVNGLAILSEWDRLIVKDNKLVLPASDYNKTEWEVSMVHFAGGDNKSNVWDIVNPEVAEFLRECIK